MNDESLISYLLYLADTNLILSQRISAWCGHGPILEQDIAITNISLDLLGQSRNFYQYAAQLMGADVDEDKLAYHRNERDFKNCLMAELPNGDWGQTVLKLYFFSQYVYLLYEKLKMNENIQLAAIAEKSVKECIYHVKWSREWVVRLGDGTEESREKMLSSLDYLWPYTGEFFMPAPYENMQTMGFDVVSLKKEWFQHVAAILEEATLWDVPFTEKMQSAYMHSGGKTGIHTEYMGFILAEMQYLQRTHPGATW